MDGIAMEKEKQEEDQKQQMLNKKLHLEKRKLITIIF